MLQAAGLVGVWHLDLAVQHDRHRAVLVRDRGVAALQIDDRQAVLADHRVASERGKWPRESGPRCVSAVSWALTATPMYLLPGATTPQMPHIRECAAWG